MKTENPTAPEVASGEKRSRKHKMVGISTLSAAVIIGMVSVVGIPAAFAAEAKVGLGTLDSYSVLGGQTVTNTGSSVLSSDLGVSPGTAITGFPPGISLGTTHAGDAPALQAQSDLTIAYDDAAGRAPTALVAGDLTGQTLVGGVYKSSSPLSVTGELTLDAQGDPNTVFIFQSDSTLITGSNSTINLVNGTQACNIYWQVGSSATLGTSSDFKGTILALTSISVNTDTTVEGRALARNGQVSLDNNVFTAPGCLTSIPTTPVETPPATTPVETPPATTPPETTPPEPAPPETTPPMTNPPVETSPPATTPPETTPPMTNPPVETSPPATTPPETTPPMTNPPVETSPPETTPYTDSSQNDELAKTGTNYSVLGLGISLLMMVLGGIIIVTGRTTRTIRKH
jgi:hypothetical protein